MRAVSYNAGTCDFCGKRPATHDVGPSEACDECTGDELTNTGIFAVVNPTPDQLHEARLGIPAASLEMDREYDPTPWCHCCGARKRENCHCGPIAENN
jgi:hypothetical protein